MFKRHYIKCSSNWQLSSRIRQGLPNNCFPTFVRKLFFSFRQSCRSRLVCCTYGCGRWVKKLCRFALKKKKTSKPLHGHFRLFRSRVDLRERCNYRIAISISFDNVSLSMKAKNCVASSKLLFCLFSRFCRCYGCVEIGSNVTMLNNS